MYCCNNATTQKHKKMKKVYITYTTDKTRLEGMLIGLGLNKFIEWNGAIITAVEFLCVDYSLNEAAILETIVTLCKVHAISFAYCDSDVITIESMDLRK